MKVKNKNAFQLTLTILDQTVNFVPMKPEVFINSLQQSNEEFVWFAIDQCEDIFAFETEPTMSEIDCEWIDGSCGWYMENALNPEIEFETEDEWKRTLIKLSKEECLKQLS